MLSESDGILNWLGTNAIRAGCLRLIITWAIAKRHRFALAGLFPANVVLAGLPTEPVCIISKPDKRLTLSEH